MNACLLVLSLSLSQAQLPPPKPLEPAPVDPSAARPAPVLVVHPISHGDFARMFKPAPGNYEVVFIHPVKGCPVRVCFSLPPGNPCVICSRRELVFDYGCRTVRIHFKLLCGRVAVNYY